MTFSDFSDEILTRAAARTPQGTSLPVGHNDARARRVIAACATVLADRGPFWVLENPDRFIDLVKRHLGTAVGLALLVASLFGGGGIWLALLRWIVPAVIDWITVRTQACGSHPGSGRQLTELCRAMTNDAMDTLRGARA